MVASSHINGARSGLYTHKMADSVYTKKKTTRTITTMITTITTIIITITTIITTTIIII